MTSLRDTLAGLLHGTPSEDPDVLLIPGPHIVRVSCTGAIFLDGHRKVASVADGAERIAAEVRLAVAS